MYFFLIIIVCVISSDSMFAMNLGRVKNWQLLTRSRGDRFIAYNQQHLELLEVH